MAEQEQMAQMEQELQAQKAGTPPAQGQPQAAPQDPNAQGGQSPEMQNMIAHLDGLPEEAKKYFAEFLTPETAKCYGILLGPEAEQYFTQLADPNITLVPVPKDVAEQQMGQMNSSEGSMPQGQVPAQPMPAQVAPAVQKPPMGVEHM